MAKRLTSVDDETARTLKMMAERLSKPQSPIVREAVAEYSARAGRLLPSKTAFDFGVHEAVLATDLYRRVKRPRHREIDIAIVACAIANNASLWTLNPEDFSDIPGLTLAA